MKKDEFYIDEGAAVLNKAMMGMDDNVLEKAYGGERKTHKYVGYRISANGKRHYTYAHAETGNHWEVQHDMTGPEHTIGELTAEEHRDNAKKWAGVSGSYGKGTSNHYRLAAEHAEKAEILDHHGSHKRDYTGRPSNRSLGPKYGM
jgi:hypothetical protein